MSLLTVQQAAVVADQPDRPVPDYDGREDPPPDAGEVLLWVPRVVFYPVYLVTEYVIRWPLGTFVTWLERERILEKTMRVFTFGTGGEMGILPTALVDFGFRPSIGLYFWTTDAFFEGNDFSTHFAWGGRDWWRLSVRDTISLDRGPGAGDSDGVPNAIGMHFLLSYRPDLLFHGIGPESPGLATRFFQDQIGGTVTASARLGELDGLLFTLHTSRNELGGGDPGREDGEVSIVEAFDASDPEQVPGLGGYVLGSAGFQLFLDSRAPRPQPGTGARLETFFDAATDFRDTETVFVRYGGEVGLFLDLTGRNRTLALRQFVGLMERFGDNPVPFPELYKLGGVDLMRGFREGRHRGEGAFVSTLQYSYPIWVFLDGYLFADVGNVFGPRLEDFDFEKMALSFGFGVRSTSERDVAIELLIGAATSRFDAPQFGIDSIRVLFGTTRGF